MIEILIGGFYAGCWYWATGIWTILTVSCCAAFWRMGGADGYSKAWRRFGVPASLCAILYFNFADINFIILSFPLLAAALHIGYGLPSTQPIDEGSFLGGYMYRLVGGDEEKANFLTRATVAILMCAALFPLAFQNILYYSISSIVWILIFAIVSDESI